MGRNVQTRGNLRATFWGDWQGFLNLIQPQAFERRYRQNMSWATNWNGEGLLTEVRRNIKDGHYASGRVPNADLTTLIKGFNQPLVDTGGLGDLFQMAQNDYKTAEVGVASQKDAKWIAAIHDGAKIVVTDSMREMFKMLWLASEGKDVTLTGRAAELFARMSSGWYPLLDSTKYIKIPRRPFFAEVVNNRGLQRIMAENWLKAGAMAVAGQWANKHSFKRLG
jgi:hypothetical protein